ncbi:hypothetical protein MNBD_DELTA04-1459 [hydrothermal vent metagenome]|uniref:Uncharacterized protein n=1 Tax=hydrothermal vent metagenome TaxID=652676 RepID=A0A3B0VN86_9ZZZZ
MAENVFQAALAAGNLQLNRDHPTTLQINVGRLCNLTCKHCHVDAGPGRQEVMGRETMAAVIEFARSNFFPTIDITGGAPEMVPGIAGFIERLAPLTQRLMMRSNLVVLLERGQNDLLELCRRLRVVIVASLPSTNRTQADSQRGQGVWEQSISMLKKLNGLGYGQKGTGLELYLVANPAGAFLPVDQCTAERKFKSDLARKWGIEFTGLFTFANVPLGRFRTWLEQSGNLDAYTDKLVNSFNPATVAGLMCRKLISVSWEGLLYDCDFNLAAGVPYTGKPVHVADAGVIAPGTPIMTGIYCFACTAGAGFT